jgi:hypothetical protein
MAILNASDFSGSSATYAVPASDSSTLYGGGVDIILSTGVTTQVFDALSTAIKTIHYMDVNSLYSLSPNEDITILNLRSKLLILENTYLNQKMMNSYVFTYHGAKVCGIHRSMSSIVSLEEALQSTGFRVVGGPWAVESNAKMETNRVDTDRPRIVIVDYKYKSPTLAHTSLEDSEPIVIRGV